tara:strand:- start:51 stop:644 length:594 start_codon:yes stop_codon:yes gene_type:complete
LKKIYLITLFVSLLAGLEFPDTDFILIFILDHRSIITHGILIPFFLYRYLTKEGKQDFINKYFSKILTSNKIKNEFLDYAYIGFLIGIAIHLCADLFPKAYIGYAMIKLPFFIPIGGPLSMVWMFGNMFFALKIAFKKLKEKNIEAESQKRIFLAIMGIGIIYLILDTNFVSKIALMVISFPIIWVYARRGYKVIKK